MDEDEKETPVAKTFHDVFGFDASPKIPLLEELDAAVVGQRLSELHRKWSEAHQAFQAVRTDALSGNHNAAKMANLRNQALADYTEASGAYELYVEARGIAQKEGLTVGPLKSWNDPELPTAKPRLEGVDKF